MIRVIVDLISAVSADRSRELGRMFIANTGTSTDPKVSDYDVAVCRKNSDALPQPFDPSGPKPTRAARVNGYPRLSYNMWRLIARSLVSAFPEERGAKPGACAVVDEQILRGLRAIVKLARHDGRISGLDADQNAAIEWLGDDESAAPSGVLVLDEVVAR